ncbi:exonuclease domain-containing protein [Paractinoplanes toevensis]|uniref:Exonuclease domain-containing protein n=1 Tax=Paractinoplanes toevensis TaxID=571911 RepID=A0A919W368_9ACTN|nr:exonuclease domain-containing protein [Actinoplanes toevensis]GIM94427.1 hypothetical protein Ato02nite_062200 [Actinoplanes toevensis]
MQRIAIVGAGGAGKTVLANWFGSLLDIPVTHLDVLRYTPEWRLVSEEDFAARQRDVVARDRWVIDGNSLASLPLRAAAADTIIVLDPHPLVGLTGILHRSLRYRGGQHADGVYDCISAEVVRYVLLYRRAAPVPGTGRCAGARRPRRTSPPDQPPRRRPAGPPDPHQPRPRPAVTSLDRYLRDPAFANIGFVILDFEGTTPAGFPPEPIEVGAVILRTRPEGLDCVARYEALIHPPAHAPLTPADTRQTGIAAAMLTGRPLAAAVLAGLDVLLTRPPYLTVAHHAPTEAGILRRYAHACPTLAATPMLDTLRLARACYPELGSHRLDDLLHHLNIPVPAERHRALADAAVTAKVLRRLLEDGSTRYRWSHLAQLRHLAGLPPPATGSGQETLF